MEKKRSRVCIDKQAIKYSLTHEWIYLEDKVVVIGVTEYVYKRFGPVINLDLPQIGDEILTCVPFGEIEFLNNTFDISSPVEGRVIEVNSLLFNKLDNLSIDPYKKGWLVKISAEDVTPIQSLLNREEYEGKFGIKSKDLRKKKIHNKLRKR